MKQLFSIIALLSIINLTMAQDLTQGLQVNDLSARVMQPLPKPGYLQTAIDPSFGTTIRRISNANPGETIVPMYSTVQAWNADESLMILYSRTDGHILLDGTTYQFIRNLDDIQPEDIANIFWDFNNPDIFYYLDSETNDFISYSVSSTNKTVIVNLETRVTNCSGFFSMGNDVQMMSWDSDVFCFRCNNDRAYYYRISTDDLVEFTIPDLNFAAPMPAPSGDFFYHETNVYDAQGILHVELNESSVEHANLGRLSDGTDAHITISFAEGPNGGCLGDIVVHNMETGDCYTVTSENQGYDYSQNGTHISALSHKNTQGGWVAASMIGAEEDGQSLLDQELVIATVDQGNIQVCRIGHHRSDEDEPELGVDEAGNNYFGEPHAVISPTGTRVLFASDWSGAEDGISIDSYVVELPSYEPEEPGELTIFCPDDATVASEDDIDPGIAGFVASCGLSDLTVSDPVINGEPNANGTTYTYTHTAIDNCGEIVTCNQVFTIVIDDIEELTITCQDDATVASTVDIVLGNPEFTVSCGLGNLSVSDPIIIGEPNANGTTYTYTFTVTDDCGGMATCNQTFTIANDNQCKLIDFDVDDDGNRLFPGTIINNQYNDFDVSTENTYRNLYPMLFDTTNPTSNDFDIGTPNQIYGGPGIGAGGWNNDTEQGNALVVSKNRYVPNETEGKLIFNFYCSVTIETIDLLDMKCGESEIELYDEFDMLINILDIPAYGVNSFNTLGVFVSGVHKMIVDLNCGGSVTAFEYCKDDSGNLCTPNPELCNEYSIDHGVNGVAWNNNATYGRQNLGNEVVIIKIDDDEDHILRKTRTDGMGLQIAIDPNNVSDQLEIHYGLSKASSNITFDITDLDYKFSYSKQQEAVCVYGLLGNRAESVLPNIISLDGSVNIEDNCAESSTDSAYGNDESILVQFTDCIDRFVIEYGTGSNSPTQYPAHSKITIGKSVFTIEQCEVGCNDNNCNGDIAGDDDDGDGVCNNVDVCPGFDDNIDENNNGIPDGCDFFRLGSGFDLNLYPNPANAGSIITISAPEVYEHADLFIFDELGRLIEQNKLNLLDGLNTWQVPPNLLKTGIYFVKIRTDAFNSKVHKLIIL